MIKPTRIIKSLLLLSFLCYFSNLFSQDKLFFSSGIVVEADVVEITETAISYQLINYPNGPHYIVSIEKVEKIIFANGIEEDFSVLQSGKKGVGSVYLAYHIFDVLYNDFSLSMEIINKKGHVGYKIPVAIGFQAGTSNLRRFRNVVYTGIGINLYPSGQKKWIYFMGPEFTVGVGEDEVPVNHEKYAPKEIKQFIYGKLLVNNGVIFRPTKNLRIASHFGMGVRYFDLARSDESGFSSAGYFTLSMAIKL